MSDAQTNRGAIHHIDLSVSDVATAKGVYRPLLEFIGYVQVRDDPDVCEWALRGREPFGASIGIRRAQTRRAHDGYAPGLQHLAWRVESRAAVDAVHDLMVARGVAVLDPPAHYPDYSGDYYAVFFADPDGIKLEVVHAPGWI